MGKIIKTDQRGRVLLPEEYGHYEVFDLAEEADRIVLTPLKLQPVTTMTKRWLKEDVQQFMRVTLLSKMQSVLEKNILPEIEAVVLFGSHAKKLALSYLDIDIAFFVDEFPSFKMRCEIHETFQGQAADLIRWSRILRRERELAYYGASDFIPKDIFKLKDIRKRET